MTFEQFRGPSDEGDINNKVKVIIKIQVKAATSLEKAYNSVTYFLLCKYSKRPLNYLNHFVQFKWKYLPLKLSTLIQGKDS